LVTEIATGLPECIKANIVIKDKGLLVDGGEFIAKKHFLSPGFIPR
jgi:hypothetical protein